MLKFLCGLLVWPFVSYKVHAYPFLILEKYFSIEWGNGAIKTINLYRSINLGDGAVGIFILALVKIEFKGCIID